MKHLRHPIVYSTMALSISFTLLMGACAQPEDKKNDQKPAAVVLGGLDEKMAQCEAQLRRSMTLRLARLQPVADIKQQIEAIQTETEEINQREFHAIEWKEQIHSLSVKHQNKDKDRFREITTTLKKAEKGMRARFIFQVFMQETRSQRDVKIGQQFLVSEKCEQELTRTTMETLKLRGKKVDWEEVTVYGEGSVDRRTDSAQLDEGQNILNFKSSLQSDGISALEQLPPKPVIFSKSLGIVELKSKPLGLRTVTKFDVTSNMKTYQLDVLKGSEVISSVKLGEDSATGFRLQDSEDSRNWSVPQKIWEKLSLGEIEGVSSLLKNEISLETLKYSQEFLIKSKKNLTYENMAAYWTLTNDFTAQPTEVLRVAELGATHGGLLSQDLQSNETIQTRLPEIQKIAGEIRAKAGSDRKEQVQLILLTLEQRLQYDHEMIKSNVLRAMTTEQVLQRGKGVCQHYAVLFASIARALEIPTRIIFGYHLGDKSAQGHAWIEAQVEPRVWKVIEPQDPGSLFKMQTRFYFPISRAWFLEDRDWEMTPSFINQMRNEILLFPKK